MKGAGRAVAQSTKANRPLSSSQRQGRLGALDPDCSPVSNRRSYSASVSVDGHSEDVRSSLQTALHPPRPFVDFPKINYRSTDVGNIEDFLEYPIRSSGEKYGDCKKCYLKVAWYRSSLASHLNTRKCQDYVPGSFEPAAARDTRADGMTAAQFFSATDGRKKNVPAMLRKGGALRGATKHRMEIDDISDYATDQSSRSDDEFTRCKGIVQKYLPVYIQRLVSPRKHRSYYC